MNSYQSQVTQSYPFTQVRCGRKATGKDEDSDRAKNTPIRKEWTKSTPVDSKLNVKIRVFPGLHWPTSGALCPPTPSEGIWSRFPWKATDSLRPTWWGLLPEQAIDERFRAPLTVTTEVSLTSIRDCSGMRVWGEGTASGVPTFVPTLQTDGHRWAQPATCYGHE